ncbi:hypothetical protein ACGF0J_30500 [Nonomuraea sp. NPDC047897]|uniref:hypothetical protein n=1 Tax=Nonomuraea sp. NPDC047897 TaxID=3364346 RepID=UPI003711FD8F
MNTAAKLGTYALGLAVVFGGALGLGNAVGSDAPAPAAATPGHDSHAEPATAPAGAAIDTPGGLQVSDNGHTLTPLTGAIKPGEPTDFRFAVTGPDGRPVTDYQIAHDKKLHLILVPRDLGDFQHLHPELGADGVWSVKLTLPDAGAYRMFADFEPTGGEALTLGADVLVAGDYAPEALPAVSRTASVDGYTVELEGELVPGRSSRLALTVSKDGKPVTDLQPYLGAYGHLVALRGGDLAYLHVHPDGEPGDGRTSPGPEIVFHAEAPSAGSYRLFLDFQHEGEVRTAAFTVHAGQAPAPAAQTATRAPKPTPTKSDAHGDHGH